MNNTFFTSCQNPKHTNQLYNEKTDVYTCCVNSCRDSSERPHMCYATCAQLFPVIKDRCAFEQECWRDGFFNKVCLEAKASIIQECCKERCERSARARQYTTEQLDCDQYCKQYNIR